MGVYVQKYVEVEVDMDDFNDEELIEELERRGKYTPSMGNTDELIDKIYHLRRQGKPYERELDEYLYQMTGRAI
jgi:hypothetical protein